MEHMIEINQLTIDSLFDDLTLVIPKGFITLSGPNNCGKTTLLRILNKETMTPPKTIKILDRYLEEYSLLELEKVLQCIIPLERIFYQNSIEEEVYASDLYQEDIISSFLELFKMKRSYTKKIGTLEEREIILFQILIALLKKPKILLIDQLSTYLSEEEMNKLFSWIKDQKITVVYATNDLKDGLLSDRTIIMYLGNVVLEGETKEVLKRDNMINKIGLKVPFMYDLSTKLMDYNLLSEVELDKNRMVDTLWKF